MLKRPIDDMPDDIRAALANARLTSDYDARPPYQRNDYLHWIARARHAEIRAKRIAQMVDELRQGGVYMGMVHTPSRKR